MGRNGDLLLREDVCEREACQRAFLHSAIIGAYAYGQVRHC